MRTCRISVDPALEDIKMLNVKIIDVKEAPPQVSVPQNNSYLSGT